MYLLQESLTYYSQIIIIYQATLTILILPSSHRNLSAIILLIINQKTTNSPL